MVEPTSRQGSTLAAPGLGPDAVRYDVGFPLQGGVIPVDQGYALFGAPCRTLGGHQRSGGGVFGPLSPEGVAGFGVRRVLGPQFQESGA